MPASRTRADAGSIAVEIVFNKFPEIAARLPRATGEVVQKTLFEIESRAKLLCPVDTGNLRASYTTEMESETSGVVFTNVEYSQFVEFGTVKMSARPHLTPAGEGARPRFMEEMQRLEGLLG